MHVFTISLHTFLLKYEDGMWEQKALCVYEIRFPTQLWKHFGMDLYCNLGRCRCPN